ncbi:MAG TPA: lysophospholipid acyltransferase family protein [Thermoanaerobaculia bacterium]|nr:lysophospholipid acyltransferase family protein [Thermoanaerobaculia bacterium]
MKHAPVRHRIEYAAYLAVKGILRALPHAAARPLGAAAGGLARGFDRRHRRVADANLALAFPELAPAARGRLVAACYRHFGAALFDLISAARFAPVELCRRFSYDGWEHLERAEGLGRGVFLLGAHLGCWEISGWPIGFYRGVIHTVARPADNPHLDRELLRLRGFLGYTVIAKRGGARRMLQVVRAGGRVGILPDQRVQEREGILVPFFGQAALTTPVLARLSIRDRCPVVPVFAYPEPGGRYRQVIRPPILPDEAADGDREAAVAALTRRYLEVIEREIRDHPEMWLWMHRRWDRKLRGSPDRPDRRELQERQDRGGLDSA